MAVFTGNSLFAGISEVLVTFVTVRGVVFSACSMGLKQFITKINSILKDQITVLWLVNIKPSCRVLLALYLLLYSCHECYL